MLRLQQIRATRTTNPPVAYALARETKASPLWLALPIGHQARIYDELMVLAFYLDYENGLLFAREWLEVVTPGQLSLFDDPRVRQNFKFYQLSVVYEQKLAELLALKRVIKVHYASGGKYFQNYFEHLLRQREPTLARIEEVTSPVNAEYLVHSILGVEKSQPSLPLAPLKFLFIGEPWDIADNLRNTYDVVIDTKLHQKDSLYLPLYWSSLYERVEHSATDLTTKILPEVSSSRPHFCAYLYQVCHPHREAYFRLLSKYAPVTALGKCMAAEGCPSRETDRTLYTSARTFYDSAVEQYRTFRFVLAVENCQRPGYITEKLINPLLAGCIPLYFGPPEVKEQFNPQRFIYLPDYSPTELLARIQELDTNPTLYAEMVSQPIFLTPPNFDRALLAAWPNRPIEISVSKPYLVFFTGYMNALDSSQGYGSELCLRQLVRELLPSYRIVIFSDGGTKNDTLPEVELYPGARLEEWCMAHREELTTLIIWRYIYGLIDYRLQEFFSRIYIWVHDMVMHAAYRGTTLRDQGRALLRNSPVTGMVTLSQWHAEKMKAAYPSVPCVMIPNGLDEEVFLAEEQKSYQRIPYRVVWFSAFDRGFEYTLSVIEQLYARYPLLEFHVYRDLTGLSSELQARCHRLPYVVLHGRVSRVQIAQACFEGDLFLYPTSFAETFCLSATEARRGGMRCLVSKVAALPETMTDYVQGHVLQEAPGTQKSTEEILQLLKEVEVPGQGWSRKGEEQTLHPASWAQRAEQWRTLLTPPLTYETRVVNLDRRPDRWQAFQDHASKVGLSNYSRKSAVDGRLLSRDARVLRIFTTEARKQSNPYGTHQYQRGQLGCALSHLELWEEQVARRLPLMLVLEDDVILPEDFVLRLEKILQELAPRSDWDFLYLGITDDIGEHPELPFTPSTLLLDGKVPRKHGGGTFAYLIRESGAQKYLKLVAQYQIHQAIDWFLFNHFDTVRVLKCVPALAKAEVATTENRVDSDIQRGRRQV